ncbi:MAG: tRNA uridine-5-carboxymethylaminomethyl(34) synthesis GTPase MnmE, partial [Opitutales bacterium]|nr:tRNA uridine-5-carboxymethylaminomethyl(34) synthesis GTPase MnmE [Opitutales bacterium]
PAELLARTTAENTIVVENKIDLTGSVSHDAFMPDFKHARVSLLEREGISELRQQWQASIEAGLKQPNADGVVVNARHAAALGDARDALELAADKLKNLELSELVAADLRDAVEFIGRVVGKVDNERMLDSLFKQFCIGK